MTENIIANTGTEIPVQSQETTVPVTETPVVQTPITEYEIDGIGKVKVDEIKEWKQSGMRQSDYTRKTQEIAAQKKEMSQAMEVYNYLKTNPQVAQQLANGQAVNLQGTPLQSINQDTSVNTEIASIRLDMELNRLKAQFPDFNDVEVLQFADKEQIGNIETAYYALKGQGSKDIEAQITKRIKAELTEQIRKNGLDTGTMINSNDKPITIDFGLNSDEVSMASKMGLTPEQYAKGKA